MRNEKGHAHPRPYRSPDVQTRRNPALLITSRKPPRYSHMQWTWQSQRCHTKRRGCRCRWSPSVCVQFDPRLCECERRRFALKSPFSTSPGPSHTWVRNWGKRQLSCRARESCTHARPPPDYTHKARDSSSSQSRLNRTGDVDRLCGTLFLFSEADISGGWTFGC